MDDDFNTGGAVGVLFELVTRAEPVRRRREAGRPGYEQPGGEGRVRSRAPTLVKEIAQILGLTFAVAASRRSAAATSSSPG